jgi:hypothetical protein
MEWVEQVGWPDPHQGVSVKCKLLQRVSTLRRRAEAGMTTAEYAVGTIAACAFAAVLLAVVRSGTVKSALASVIATALGSAS